MELICEKRGKQGETTENMEKRPQTGRNGYVCACARERINGAKKGELRRNREKEKKRGKTEIM